MKLCMTIYTFVSESETYRRKAAAGITYTRRELNGLRKLIRVAVKVSQFVQTSHVISVEDKVTAGIDQLEEKR